MYFTYSLQQPCQVVIFILILKMRPLKFGQVKYLSKVSELLSARAKICPKFYAFKNTSADIGCFRTIISLEFMLIFISDITVKFLRPHISIFE